MIEITVPPRKYHCSCPHCETGFTCIKSDITFPGSPWEGSPYVRCPTCNYPVSVPIDGHGNYW